MAPSKSNGKSSGSWKSWKSNIAWWIKAVFIVIGIFIGALLGLFITYKTIHSLRVNSLNKEIATLQAQLDY